MPVDKIRVALLVDALESGTYSQGHNRLTTVDDYGNEHDCCLGVGCKVAIQNGLDLATEETSTAAGEGAIEYGADAEVHYMPPEVMAWFGFEAKDPMIAVPVYTGLDEDDEEQGVEFIAASLANDDRGLPFEDIAAGFRRAYLTEEDED